MNFNPLFEAGPVIQLHTAAAFVAIGLSLAVLAARKGTSTHKVLGRLWVVMMAAVSISSFGIMELRHGQLSPIHLLSVVTLTALVYAIWQARRGNIRAHKRSMLFTMVGALGGAGAFTLMPGRILGQVFFG